MIQVFRKNHRHWNSDTRCRSSHKILDHQSNKIVTYTMQLCQIHTTCGPGATLQMLRDMKCVF